MGDRTPLYEKHCAAGAKIVDFGGWDMPLHYGSQLDEHHAVRKTAGCFDVSHMTVVDVSGRNATDYLRHVLANDVGRLTTDGAGLYSVMLTADGGIVDDLIAYRLVSDRYRLVVNASTRKADLEWLLDQSSGFEVSLEERADLAMLAVQGPDACDLAASCLPTGLSISAQALAPFHVTAGDKFFVARTGYTGEDGWEIICDSDHAGRLWDALMAAGVTPCGLGARDTLRLEAGLNLYGQDMDLAITPAECGLAWTVSWQDESRAFIGRRALEDQRDSGLAPAIFRGLILEGRGIMRHGQRVETVAGDGLITSGTYSPTLEKSIALARLPAGADTRCQVEIRNRLLPARVVRPPFVRNGQIRVTP
jgi:aminomethyltransferase